MRKITNRAVSVLILAVLVIIGLNLYILRYIDDGKDWAMAFSNLNTDSTGDLMDRNGVVLASLDDRGVHFNTDETIRVSNYHVTGDAWGRTSTGLMVNYWGRLQDYSLITGSTNSRTASLTLNIDSRVNRAAYYALAGRKGAVLVCNYRTGELLCMVSTPAMDPIDVNAVPEDGAFINRCLSASFTPGSVFKLITAAAVIENIPNIDDMSFYCEGEYKVAGVPIVCSGEHYTQTFEQALSNSCNVAFSQLAIRLGQDKLLRYVKNLGFISPQRLDGIPTASGTFPSDFIGDPELGWAGIGQSTDMICPYSLLRFVCAVGNGGILCEPKLVNDGKDAVKSRYLEESTADKLKQMMAYNAVNHYQGSINFPGLALCAKTGTAELGDGTSHAWFTGFLDDEAHPYAFVVFIERGGGGLSQAGPVANSVLQAAVYG